MIFKQTLHIACWNINGYQIKGYNKYSDPVFINNICNKDIVCLLETHCPLQESISLPNFTNVHLVRPRNKKTNKISGGLSVLVKSDIKEGIKFLEHSNDNYIWLKLSKQFFGISDDIYLCYLYNPPAYSSYTKSLQEDLFELIENDLANYTNKGNILLMGDFNARTGNETDFIQNDYSNNKISIFNDYDPDSNILNRYSRDGVVLPRGRALNDICVQTGIRILNGRCIGDTIGNYTCHNYNGSSVVDYACISECLLSYVKFFSVHEFLPDLSDHCQISLLLRINCKIKFQNENTHPLPIRYKWNENSSFLFQDALSKPAIQSKIQHINSTNYVHVDNMVEDINTVLWDAADTALSKKSNKQKKSIRTAYPKWYDENLYTFKRNLIYKQKLFEKYKGDPIIRGNFFCALKFFRKARKLKMREFHSTVIDQLDTLLEKNPKEYWTLLEKLSNPKNSMKNSEETNITPTQWLDYFKNLNKQPNRTSDDIFSKLKEVEQDKIYTELDNKITRKEINNAICGLKNNKASSFDSILNEMLKHSQPFILECLYKLFNYILSHGEYPKKWSFGILVPIFKNGEKNDPVNYRGLAISSNICKLFNKIMNFRLNNFCLKRNLICSEQIGFCKGKRTSDHIFVLKTLIDKYTQKGSKRLYSCFVDFRKAFDTVRHEELLYKLRLYGVSDLFYNVIKSMYLNTYLSVKVDSYSLTDNFQSFIGVRQGDNLSSILFNLFINDIPSIFNHSCCPVQLDHSKINCLMYADDLVLLSESEEGLQNCLIQLYNYCEKWGLYVNVKKTKSLVFNNTGRLFPIKLHYDKLEIENVRSYTYLGINFSISGTFTEAKNDLHKRGLKAYFKLKKCFEHHKPKIKTVLHVFDHTIKPILLYGSEIWGVLDFKKLKKLQDIYFNKLCDDFPAEKIHVKICKYVLEVSRRATNIAVMSELGRYPLYLETILNMLKYFSRLTKIENCLAGEAFNTSVNLYNENKKSWYGSIVEVMHYFNLDKNKILNLKTSLKCYINTQLHGKYKDLWRDSLFNDNRKTTSGNKLRTFRLFKDKFIKEKYLDWGNYTQRKLITKFRISTHNLEIEQGRYNNTPLDKRICKLCNTVVEDEVHFLLECPRLQNKRQLYITNIEYKFKNIKLLSNKTKFIWLMSAEDPFIYNQLYLLLKDLFLSRQELLNTL